MKIVLTTNEVAEAIVQWCERRKYKVIGRKLMAIPSMTGEVTVEVEVETPAPIEQSE